MKSLKVKISKKFYPLNIKKIEDKYNAKYLGDFQIKKPDGTWNNNPCAIFYVENPDVSKNHSNYLGIYRNIVSIEPLIYSDLILCDASSFHEDGFTAIKHKNTYYISCYNHHFNAIDSNNYIDGGRNYTRHSGNSELYNLILIKDKFFLK